MTSTTRSIDGPSTGATAARSPGREGRGSSESGHLLILLMVGITVMLIMLTVAAQSWTFRIRREMEVELIFRGEQYIQGLKLYREKMGGGFPVGSLEVLTNKNPEGGRFMRKLYKNPFDKKGKWQYLFLHPGGSGFINPCANAQAAFAAGGLTGQVPVGGIQMVSGTPGARIGGPRGLGGGNRRSSRSRRSRAGSDLQSQLSALDPETFRRQGGAGLNMPIVGVVNCVQEASIRTYQGQAWLSNWAFTPLAQGEFGGKAAPGHLVVGSMGGPKRLGMAGASFSMASDMEAQARRMPFLDEDNLTKPGRLGEAPWGSRRAQQREAGLLKDDERGEYQWRRPGTNERPHEAGKDQDPNSDDEDPNSDDEDPNSDDEDPNSDDEDPNS